MAGGGSEDPTVLMKISLTFEEFDWRQQLLIGFGITVYAILKNPKRINEHITSLLIAL
jgi:hypothetical protein